MKILWIDPEDSKFCIGILDGENYVHAKLKTKGWESYQFFNSIRAAVERRAKSKANDECTDLSDWLARFDEVISGFSGILQHTKSLNREDAGRGGRVGRDKCMKTCETTGTPRACSNQPKQTKEPEGLL